MNYYHRARFLKSTAKFDQLPPNQGIEVCFAGRSNAGKSSAINTICQQKSLARTSKTPGRTQLINFFQLSDEHLLVDLPGYGYAKVPEAMRLDWQKFINQYLTQRDALNGVVLVMDIRHPLQPFDEQMLEWTRDSQLNTHILLSKCDKLKPKGADYALQDVKAELEQREYNASVQLFSSLKHYGVMEARAQLDTWFHFAEKT